VEGESRPSAVNDQDTYNSESPSGRGVMGRRPGLGVNKEGCTPKPVNCPKGTLALLVRGGGQKYRAVGSITDSGPAGISTRAPAPKA